jgi:hypothetical protein
MHVHAHRQVLLQALHGDGQVVAQRNHVAALGHYDAEPDRIATGNAHPRLWRIGQAACHACDVAEAETAPADGKAGVAQGLDADERAADAQAHPIGLRFDLPGRHRGILPLQRIEHLGRHQAHRGQTRRTDVDVDFFVLHADQLDLLYVVHPAQLARQTICLATQIAHAVASLVVACDEGKNLDLHIAELVVGEGPLYAGGQGMADIVKFLAYLAPGLGNLGLRRVILEDHDGQRFARLRCRAQHVHPGRLGQFLLDALGQLLFHLRRRGARPKRTHHHDLEGEVGVFGAAELEEGNHPADHEHDHQVEHHRLVPQGPFGKIELPHLAFAWAMRTFSPVVSRFTPAATMVSPPASPSLTTAPASV